MNLQFVKWFPHWQGFAFARVNKNSSLHYIYDWCAYIGFWEIRKWHKLTKRELASLKHNKEV